MLTMRIKHTSSCSEENHLKILKIRFVFVSRAPYTIEKPRPTPNLWRVQVIMVGLASSRKVLMKQTRTPESST